MRPRTPLAVLALSIALAASPSRAQTSTCSGSLSGAVSAKFDCTVEVKEANGTVTFRIAPALRVAGVRSMEARFEVKGPLALKTYQRADLAGSRADLTTGRGRVFRSADGAAPRGDFSVSVEQLEREARGALLAVASVRASLVPKAGVKGTVSMEVAFTTSW